MRHLRIREFQRIQRDSLKPRLLRRLQRFDQAFSATSGQTVFDWSGISAIRAQNYVGIVQVAGLVVEILPKITATNTENDENSERALAQKNLLYMLSVAGEIPFEERQLADQHQCRLPLIEVLVAAFARSLVRELRRGVARNYVAREENLLFLRGKMLHGLNATLNAAHQERLYARYEEFLADTPLNRILRATSERLGWLPLRTATATLLREASSLLADVEDVEVTLDLFKQVHLNRNTERFAPLLEFCRLVLRGQMPTPGRGKSRTFSLLFPMEQVFEGFVGGILRRHAGEFGLLPGQVRIQSRGKSRWLVWTANQSGRFKLRPDVLIEGLDRRAVCVLDTKWKRPKTDAEDRKNGILSADMYQLFAYADRFDTPENVLLYPAVAGATAKAYGLYEPKGSRRIRVEFLNMARDLHVERSAVLSDLRAVLGGDAVLK